MNLEAHQLACTRGDRHLFSELNFTVDQGDAMRIVGTNGSGKTSLLRILCGLACPATGEVRWDGKNIRAVRDDFCRQMLYLGHMNGVKDDLLAWENIVVASTMSGKPVSRDDAYQALDAMGLDAQADLPTRALSQGQRKRVALSRLHFALNTSLWILDEPFTALDQQAVTALCGTLDVHLAGGGIVVYTTHQEINLSAHHMLTVDLDRKPAC